MPPREAVAEFLNDNYARLVQNRGGDGQTAVLKRGPLDWGNHPRNTDVSVALYKRPFYANPCY